MNEQVQMPGLIVDVEARITKLERGLQKANEKQRKAAREMEERARQSADKIGAAYNRVGDGAARGFDRLGNVFKGRIGWQIQQTATQLGDVATQIGGGTSAMRAFGMQAAQLLGPFGTMGALAGTAAAALIPLASGLLSSGDAAGTAEDRLKALNETTDDMVQRVQTAATPIADLRGQFGDLADEIQRANGVMAAFAAGRAERDALGAARGLSGELGIDLSRLKPDATQLPAGANADRLRVEMQAQADAAAEAMEQLADKTGASADQAERLRMALNRTDSANSLQAVVQDSENLLAVLDELHNGATDAQQRFLESWAVRIEGVMNAARRQIEAQRAEDQRLIAAYDQNTVKQAQLAEDRKAAEEKLTQAKLRGDQDQIASMQRVIAGIDQQIQKVAELSSTYRELQTNVKSAAAEFMSGAFEKLIGSTPAQFAQDASASEKGLLELIKSKESGGNYNAQWGDGRFSGGQHDFTNMTLREVLAIQRQMLAHPDNDRNSSAAGAYQIVGTTLGGKGLDGSGGLVKALGLSLDDLFTPELQDRMATELIRQRRGQGIEGLRNEWEGLRSVSPALIQQAMGNTAVPVEDPETVKARAQASREEADARRDAARAAEEQAKAFGTSTLAGQAAADAAQQAIDQQAAGARALTDVLMAAGQGSDALAQALTRLAAQILEVRMVQAMNGAGGAGGGFMGWLGKLLGVGGGGDPLTAALRGIGLYAEGGWTGPGGKFEPAGVVHKGEFVMSAAATRAIGVQNLEALHRAAKHGFAEGGAVGQAGRLAVSAARSSASKAAPAPAPNISITGGPITVNASGGTPEQNDDLARKIAYEHERSMRGLIQDELVRQMRPGGLVRR